MNKILGTLLFSSLMGCMSISSAEPPRVSSAGSLQVCESFEDRLSNMWGMQSGTKDNISPLRTDEARRGQRVVRFKVHRDDPWVAGGPRSEMMQSRQMGAWEENTGVWVGGSIRFPENYQDDPMQEIVWQVHAIKRASSSDRRGEVPFFIQSTGSRLIIQGKGFRPVEIERSNAQWIDIVVGHKWSSRGEGVTQVYVDGTLLVDANNISNMIKGDKLYWKFGIYKSGWKKGGDKRSTVSSREIWYDEIKIGPYEVGYQGVSPGVDCI